MCDQDPVMSEELFTLLKLRNQIQLQISVLNEENEFLGSIDDSNIPFVQNFLHNFKNHFTKTRVENDILFLNEIMGNIVQQIKGICKHNYEEDYLDCTSGSCDTSMKITYCSICESTFLQL